VDSGDRLAGVRAGIDDAEPPSLRVAEQAPVERRGPSTMSDIVGPLVVFGLFVGAWYLLSTVILPEQKRFLLPTPHEVVTEGFLVWEGGRDRGLKPILESLWQSAKIALGGLTISIVVGLVLATLMSLSRWAERAVWPYLVGVQAAPILALTPLISALLGFGASSRLLVVVLISYFPIVNNTLFGLLSVDRSHHELFTLQGAGRWTRLTKLQYPAALPNIFVGLRNAAGLAVIGAVVGDFYFRQGGTVGIGAQIDVYRQRLWGPEMIAAIILAALLGLAVFIFFGWLGRRAIGAWHTETRAS
jgi:NitT/TauT family transport system permease protein